MADPLGCLRAATICIAIWNIIYCFIQFGLLGWQFQVVKDIIAEFENRQLPATGFVDGFQARFPGLYEIYTETPERRRANAMYVIIIVCVILAIANLLTSATLLYAAIKYLKVLMWPWFATSVPLCIMTTVYAVLWWSGDVFNEQLTMSVFEFVMSVAVNSITIIVVVVYFSRLNGSLLSTRPKNSRRRKRKHVQRIYLDAPHHHTQQHAAPYLEIDTSDLFSPKPRGDVAYPPPANLPDWRREWPSVPDVELQKKMKRRRKEERRRQGFDVAPPFAQQTGAQGNTIDFYAPEAGDATFPWKMKTLQENYHDRKQTQANKIKTLYYQHWPEDLPNMPIEMRRRMQEDRDNAETQRNKSRLKYFEDS